MAAAQPRHKDGKFAPKSKPADIPNPQPMPTTPASDGRSVMENGHDDVWGVTIDDFWGVVIDARSNREDWGHQEMSWEQAGVPESGRAPKGVDPYWRTTLIRSTPWSSMGIAAWCEGDTEIAEQRRQWVAQCMRRHASGDWGECGHDPRDERHDAITVDEAREDFNANTRDSEGDGRVLSSYNVPDELLDPGGSRQIWIITDGVIHEKGKTDRGVDIIRPRRYETTILFPDEN